MNELLRVFDRLLKPFGYRVRRSEKYVLRPVRNLKDLADGDALGSAYRGFETVDMAAPGEGLDRLIVCFRTCMRVNRRPNTTRPGGATQEDVVLRCLNSLVRAVNDEACKTVLSDLRIVVLDDHSDPSELAKIEDLLKRSAWPYEIVTTASTGQGPSLHEGFAFGASQDCLVYFCEDDYLYFDSAIAEMAAFYQQMYRQTGGHVVLHPQEQVRLYAPHYPSYILKSDTRHWRTTSHMTHTLFTHGQVVRDHWGLFENTKYIGVPKKRRIASESKTTNRLLEIIPGLCPIPPLGVHLHSEEDLPPFFDWRRLWDQNDPAA